MPRGKHPASHSIELTNDEALVLFEYLSEHIESDQFKNLASAEKRVLWDILAALEKALPEPFLPDYAKIVAAARERLREPS